MAGADTPTVDGQRRRAGDGQAPDGRLQLPPQGEVRTRAQVTDPKALLEQDVPSEEIFVRLAQHLCKLEPEASDALIEHLVALEKMHCRPTAFGLSLKAAKVQLAGALAKMLGGLSAEGPASRTLRRPLPLVSSRFPVRSSSCSRFLACSITLGRAAGNTKRGIFMCRSLD